MVRYLRRIRKTYDFLRAYGLTSLRGRTIDYTRYRAWIAQNDENTEQRTLACRADLAELTYKPLISIALPVYNTHETYVRQAIESVVSQTYENWELCVADDNSSSEAIRLLIQTYAQRDTRIKYTFRSRTGGISAATNTAASLASGEFIGFLDHDDMLPQHALCLVAKELNQYPESDLVFTDEDRISPRNERHNPYFKSGWNPELMLSHNAVCHFMLARASLFRELGGMRSECDGAQDWDLALRISERTSSNKIRHIPQILYHWREIPGSTARALDAKPYVTRAQRRVVEEHLARRGESNSLVSTLPGTSMLQVDFALPSRAPLVSIIVKSHEPEATQKILRSTNYKPVEVLVVEQVNDENIRTQATRSNDPGAKFIKRVDANQMAKAFNDAASLAAGDVVCFLTDVLPHTDPNWLSCLVAQALRDEVGIVGPKILRASDNNVQSIGVRLTTTGPLELGADLPSRHPGYFNSAILARDVVALGSGCMVLRREVFESVGGFDEERFPTSLYNIDLCMRIRDSGKRILCDPRSVVVSRRVASVLHPEPEISLLHSRWPAESTCNDSYVHGLVVV